MSEDIENAHNYYCSFESKHWIVVNARSIEKCFGKINFTSLNNNTELKSFTTRIEVKDRNKIKEHLDYLYDILYIKTDQRLYAYPPETDIRREYFLSWAEKVMPQATLLYKNGNENIFNLFHEIKFYIAILSEFNMHNRCIVKLEY